MTSKQKYNLKKKILISIIICFEVLNLARGEAGRFAAGYPFFNWNLFSKIPEQKSDYSFLITEIDHKKSSAVYYEVMQWKYKGKTVHNLAKFCNIFNHSFEEPDASKYREEEVKKMLSDKHSFKLAFVRREFDTLERWKSKNKFVPQAFTRTKTLEEYEVN